MQVAGAKAMPTRASDAHLVRLYFCGAVRLVLDHDALVLQGRGRDSGGKSEKRLHGREAPSYKVNHAMECMTEMRHARRATSGLAPPPRVREPQCPWRLICNTSPPTLMSRVSGQAQQIRRPSGGLRAPPAASGAGTAQTAGSDLADMLRTRRERRRKSP